MPFTSNTFLSLQPDMQDMYPKSPSAPEVKRFRRIRQFIKKKRNPLNV